MDHKPILLVLSDAMHDKIYQKVQDIQSNANQTDEDRAKVYAYYDALKVLRETILEVMWKWCI